MFIRRLSYRLKPEHNTEAEHARMKTEPIEAFKEVEGHLGGSWLPTEVKGEYEMISIYMDEASCLAATPKVRAEWARHADMLLDQPILERYGTALRDI